MMMIFMPQKQFEEYRQDNHINARAYHDKPIDKIRLFQIPVKSSKG